MTKGRATADDLIAGAERFAVERANEDPQFTKHPTTWLNGGHWADEPAPRHRARPQGRRGYGALERLMEESSDGD